MLKTVVITAAMAAVVVSFTAEKSRGTSLPEPMSLGKYELSKMWQSDGPRRAVKKSGKKSEPKMILVDPILRKAGLRRCGEYFALTKREDGQEWAVFRYPNAAVEGRFIKREFLLSKLRVSFVPEAIPSIEFPSGSERAILRINRETHKQHACLAKNAVIQ